MFIQDDFCPDEKILDKLSDIRVWESLQGKSCWWEGWWAQAPRNIWEYIIQMIWSSRGAESNIAGFEYWCNILDADNQAVNHLGWHIDKDEKLKQETGENVCPIAGTIFYGYPHNISGGFLEIATEPTFTDSERISAKYNRVIIMDVSKQHRVSRIYRGIRVGLQINLWKIKPTLFADSDTAAH